jgi:immunity protein 7 of polymorphic toxin system
VYEVHGWFGLSESTHEADVGGLLEAVEEIKTRLAGLDWPNGSAALTPLNGQYFLILTRFANRPRNDRLRIYEILSLVAKRLPGSWGLLYERDDETQDPPGPNAFRVRVLRRGTVVEETDPFLSPCRPIIED